MESSQIFDTKYRGLTVQAQTWLFDNCLQHSHLELSLDPMDNTVSDVKKVIKLTKFPIGQTIKNCFGWEQPLTGYKTLTGQEIHEHIQEHSNVPGLCLCLKYADTGEIIRASLWPISKRNRLKRR